MGFDNAAVARRFMTEVWGKGNLEAVDELVDKDIVVRDTMGLDLKGIDKVKAMLEEMQGIFSDNTFTIEDVIVAGDRVVLRYTWSGTHRGNFFGLEGTGRKIKAQACDVLRISNGKVVEELGYMDSYTMFQQLGVLPERDKLIKPGQAPSAPQPSPNP